MSPAGGTAQSGWEEGLNKASDQRAEEGGLDPIKLRPGFSWKPLPGETPAPPSGDPSSCGSQAAIKHKSWGGLKERGLCVHTHCPRSHGSPLLLPGAWMGALGWDSPAA